MLEFGRPRLARPGDLSRALGAAHRNAVVSGSSPRRTRPTVSKCVCRPCNCWATVCASRKRRSKGFASKIAVAPAVDFAYHTAAVASVIAWVAAIRILTR